MVRRLSIDELWKAAGPEDGPRVFDPAGLRQLPGPARRYLAHAIPVGERLASRVRLRMHGEIKVSGWFKFRAEEVIHAELGLLWRARVWRGPFVLTGFDTLLEGVGAMRWKLFGLIPMVRASGPDIDRAAAGRLHAESIWLPGLLLPSSSVVWENDGGDGNGGDEKGGQRNIEGAMVSLTSFGETSELRISVGEDGAIRDLTMMRWGDPNERPFAYHPFSAIVEEERTFCGHTVPSRMRVGWGTLGGDFEKGEFFRVSVDSAEFR